MHKKGFTLIELMVSVAIFSIVMTMSLGALLSIIAAERKAETLKSVVNNLHFALDSMTRSIRTGYGYNCGSSSGGNCASGGTILYFTDAAGRSMAYCRGNGSTCDASGTAILEKINAGPFVPITTPEVLISNFTFYLVGAPQGDAEQPKVTVTLSGSVQVSEAQSSIFEIQTTITQRLYDL